MLELLLVFTLIQIPDPPLSVGEPFTALADHDGVGVTEYRLRINDTVVATRPVADLADGSIRFPQPTGLPVGSYTAVAEALEGADVVATSPALTFMVGPSPQTQCTDAPLTIAITDWPRSASLRDARGLAVSFKFIGPARVKRIRLDLMEDGTPGWEMQLLEPSDGRNILGLRVKPTVIGKWTLVIEGEDDRGCVVRSTGPRGVEVVK